jgi:hypothetical protein
MRRSVLVSAALAAMLSGAASAQDAAKEWSEFVDRTEHFTVNFPGEPDVKETRYTTAKGTMLPAKIFTAEDRRGRYTITVVNYTAAEAEQASARDEAAASERKKGAVRYDGQNDIDRVTTQRITVEANGRLVLAEIMLHQGRLYISEADVAVGAPPPAQFQASLQVLDDDGVRIRYNRDGVTRQR